MKVSEPPRAAWKTRGAAPFEAAPWIDARFR
jgi:hypothetical protein